MEVPQTQFIVRCEPETGTHRQFQFLDKVVGRAQLCNDRCSTLTTSLMCRACGRSHCMGFPMEAFGRKSLIFLRAARAVHIGTWTLVATVNGSFWANFMPFFYMKVSSDPGSILPAPFATWKSGHYFHKQVLWRWLWPVLAVRERFFLRFTPFFALLFGVECPAFSIFRSPRWPTVVGHRGLVHNLSVAS